MRNVDGLQSLGLWEGWFFEQSRAWSRRMFHWWLQGCGLQASGEPWKTHSGPFLFAATHASYLDFWAVLESLPKNLRQRTYVAAARDYFYQDSGRRLLTRLGSYHNFPFNRDLPSPEEFRRLADVLRAGYSLLIFPQGTRSRDGRLLAFKPLTAMLALETNAELVPVAVRGTWEAWPADRMFPRRWPIRVAFGQVLQRPASGGPVSRQARQWNRELQECVETLWKQLETAAISPTRV